MKKGQAGKLLAAMSLALLLAACGSGYEAPVTEGEVAENIEETLSEPEEQPDTDRDGQSKQSEKPVKEQPEGAEKKQAEEPMKEQSGGEKVEAMVVNGLIESVGQGSFVISEILTQEMENGSSVMVSDPGNKTLITVKFTEDTEFTVKTSTDGMTSTDREGAPADLEPARHVTLTGSFEQEAFNADKVEIINIDL